MQTLSETKRMAVAGTLVILGFIIIVGGLVSVGNLFTEPFNLPFAEQPDPVSEEEKARENLVTKDTDKDGLNDYDEMYVYNTSPYLSDSDSDGKNDLEEVEAGDDPNCPQGQNCYGAILDLEEESQPPLAPSNEYINAIPEEDREAIKEVLPKDLTSDEIRQMLKEAGLDDNILEQLSDEEILETYQQTLNAF